MSYALYANDYLAWDDTESVSLTLRRPGGNLPLEGITAKRSTPGQSRGSSGDGTTLIGTDLVWHIPATLLEGNELREGDLITNANEKKWRISRTDLKLFRTVYTCQATQERD